MGNALNIRTPIITFLCFELGNMIEMRGNINEKAIKD